MTTLGTEPLVSSQRLVHSQRFFCKCHYFCDKELGKLELKIHSLILRVTAISQNSVGVVLAARKGANVFIASKVGLRNWSLVGNKKVASRRF